MQRPGLSTAASNRKLDEVAVMTEAQLIDSYFKQLRHKLYCKSHSKFCFVRGNTFAPAHEELDDMAISYWARMIVGGDPDWCSKRY